MKIGDFAKERNVEKDTITKYIQRHKDDFNGHTFMHGNAMHIDEVGYEILDKKYPLPSPIIIQEDVELIKKYAAAKDELNKALDKIAELTAKNSELQIDNAAYRVELSQLRGAIEDKATQNEELRADNENLGQQLATAKTDAAVKSKEIERLTVDNMALVNKNAAIMGRGLIARILNKDVD